MSEVDFNNLESDDFDFTNSSITEKEYYMQLDSFLELPWVSEVKHSLPLNSISIESKELDYINFGHVNNDIPKDIHIRKIFVKDNMFKFQLSSTKWLCNVEQKSKYFPGEYSHEAMAYLLCELRLIMNPNSIDITSRDNSNELEIKINFNSQKYPIEKLDDVCSYMGFSISEFEIKDGSVSQLYLKFDESRPFDREQIKKYQQSKYEDVIRDITYNSSQIELPSGEFSTPQIWMIQEMNDENLEKFPKTKINAPDESEHKYQLSHKIDVKNTNDAIMKVSEWPNNVDPITTEGDSTAMLIRYGYACPKTNTLYILQRDSKIFSSLVNFESNINTYTVTYDNTEYKFELFN